MAASPPGETIMSCLVIAEAGVNHNGDPARARALVEAARQAGADAVKFQTFSAEGLVRRGTPTADYQRRQTGEGDQYTMLKALELPRAVYPDLVACCRALEIEFMSSPFDEESAEFLVRLGMRRIKAPSGELTNLPFLGYLTAFGLPMILSTGMGSLEEVGEAVATIAHVRQEKGLREPLAERLTLLHCTSNYPAAVQDVNLRAMQTLAAEFGVPVGYSDHTAGSAIAVGAVALGAVVVEKHFTLDRTLPGPDHQASLEPAELARMIADIRACEEALGDGQKVPRPREIGVRDVVRRSVTLVRDVAAGQVLARDDLALLRPGDGIPPKDLARVLGRRARRALVAGTRLDWTQLE
jgi:N,N'-diacetyllegionaminate synthase